MKLEKLTQNSRGALEYGQQLAESEGNPEITGLRLINGL